jgi:hypothetical protein
MVTSTIEMASTLDLATLDALRESVAGVLAEQCGSTEVLAFIDGKNALVSFHPTSTILNQAVRSAKLPSIIRGERTWHASTTRW